MQYGETVTDGAGRSSLYDLILDIVETWTHAYLIFSKSVLPESLILISSK